MAEISNITIKNIKGFMDQNNSFDVHILPNKVNLLVAPNGFGKSSIAKGFESLNSNRLVYRMICIMTKTLPYCQR